MKLNHIFILSLVLLYSSCITSDDSAPTQQFLLGEVISITQGSDGQSIELTTPNNQNYNVIINDPSINVTLTEGNNVALKGMDEESNFFRVTKVISINTNEFQIRGTVGAIIENQEGYFAEILGSDDETYNALLSISNLGDDYTQFSVNETREIKGTLSLLSQSLQVKVEKIIE